MRRDLCFHRPGYRQVFGQIQLSSQRSHDPICIAVKLQPLVNAIWVGLLLQRALQADVSPVLQPSTVEVGDLGMRADIFARFVT